jgi:membrane associated rhomboid family serine protease
MYRTYPSGRVFLGIRLTPVVKRLIIITGCIYVIQVIFTLWLKVPQFTQHLGLTPSRVVNDLEIWQVFTYMFLHSEVDPFHIILNMLALWLFGHVLEQRWGGRYFLKFYLLTGIFAGLFVLLVGIFWYPDVITVGASGAIYGLIIAFGILYPHLPVYIFGIFPLRGKVLVWLIVGMTGLYWLTRVPGISIAAHVGGMVAGALWVTGYFHPLKVLSKIRSLRRPGKVEVIRWEDDSEDSGRYLH